LRAFKDGICHTMQAPVDLREGKDSRRGRRRGSSRANLGNQAARKEKNCGQS
jgi:hypothetical protein